MSVSLVLGFGLEHSCPRPREGRSVLERSVSGLALGFFLFPWPRMLSSTPPPLFSGVVSYIAIELHKREKLKKWKSFNVLNFDNFGCTVGGFIFTET